MVIAEIVSALSGIKTAMDIGKGILAAGSSLDHAQLKLELADMMGALADARVAVVEAQETTSALQLEVKRLDEALEIKQKVVKDGSAYFDIGADGKSTGGGYCMRCWEVDKKLRHLAHPSFSSKPSSCPACKTEYDEGQTYAR